MKVQVLNAHSCLLLFVCYLLTLQMLYLSLKIFYNILIKQNFLKRSKEWPRWYHILFLHLKSFLANSAHCVFVLQDHCTPNTASLWCWPAVIASTQEIVRSTVMMTQNKFITVKFGTRFYDGLKSYLTKICKNP